MRKTKARASLSNAVRIAIPKFDSDPDFRSSHDAISSMGKTTFSNARRKSGSDSNSCGRLKRRLRCQTQSESPSRNSTLTLIFARPTTAIYVVSRVVDRPDLFFSLQGNKTKSPIESSERKSGSESNFVAT